ncbi:MAG: alpha amylase family protein [Tidjanibacter sp.]|nr:alpha amylase family protein [Tidjanibacter sp.]
MRNLLIKIAVAAALLGCNTKNDPPKRLYMWLDCEANFERLSSPDSIVYYIDKLQQTGFTDVVVDVKSIMGEVLYRSNIAPQMSSWNGTVRPDDYDMLSIVEQACHSRGMGCYASLNVFAGGHNFIDRGIIYSSHPEWQSTAWWHNELLPISQMKWNYNGMLNPADPAVREYELSVLEEFARLYPSIDGIIFDRVRYDDISSDFSDLSKTDFEAYAGITADDFPKCIMEWHCSDEGKWSWTRGKYFKEWVEYRANVIKSFVEEAHRRLKAINPELLLGDYTGAWYPTYYYVGVNWASRLYNPADDFDWATDNYYLTGYADLLDLYMTGLYFTPITKREVDLHYPDIGQRMEAGMDAEAKNHWYCVEGGAELAAKITCGVVPVTGSIYVEQYNGDVGRFERAVTQAIESCDGGMMLFDMCHICSRNWWPNLKQAIDKAK